MSRQIIDTSTSTDTLQSGFEKTNANFLELYQGFVPGCILDYIGATAPTGWLISDGGTIGNASSSGTSRANADTQTLFVLIWNSISSASVSGGRGANAEADFAANKTIVLPDLRGKTTAGQDSGTFNIIGASVGSETHNLTEAELPVVGGHTHSGVPTGGSASVSADTAVDNTLAGSTVTVAGGQSASVSLSGDTITASDGGFGSGSAHNNIQPTFVVNKIIKL